MAVLRVFHQPRVVGGQHIGAAAHGEILVIVPGTDDWDGQQQRELAVGRRGGDGKAGVVNGGAAIDNAQPLPVIGTLLRHEDRIGHVLRGQGAAVGKGIAKVDRKVPPGVVLGGVVGDDLRAQVELLVDAEHTVIEQRPKLHIGAALGADRVHIPLRVVVDGENVVHRLADLKLCAADGHVVRIQLHGAVLHAAGALQRQRQGGKQRRRPPFCRAHRKITAPWLPRRPFV